VLVKVINLFSFIGCVYSWFEGIQNNIALKAATGLTQLSVLSANIEVVAKVAERNAEGAADLRLAYVCTTRCFFMFTALA